MAKQRHHNPVHDQPPSVNDQPPSGNAAPATDAQEVEAASSEEPQLPIGLKEGVPQEDEEGTSKRAAMEAALKDVWQLQEDKWINTRDFKTKDAAVPQGVIRSLEEAYNLEVQRCG